MKLGAGLSVQTMEGTLCFCKQTLFLQFFLVSPVEQNYEHAFFFFFRSFYEALLILGSSFSMSYGKITIPYKPCFVTVPTYPAESTAVITYQKPAWASHVLIDPFDWLNIPSALHGPGDRKDRYSPTRWNDWSSSKTSSLLSPKQNTPAEEKSGIMIRFKRLVTAPAGQQHSYGNEGQQIWNITRPPYQVCVSLYYAWDIMRMWLKAFQRQIKLKSWWDSHFNIYSISAESQRPRTGRWENLLAGQKKA